MPVRYVGVMVSGTNEYSRLEMPATNGYETIRGGSALVPILIQMRFNTTNSRLTDPEVLEHGSALLEFRICPTVVVMASSWRNGVNCRLFSEPRQLRSSGVRRCAFWIAGWRSAAVGGIRLSSSGTIEEPGSTATVEMQPGMFCDARGGGYGVPRV